MVLVLVLEDKESLRNLIATYLEEAGFNSVCVKSGPEALEAVEKNKIDLMITEVLLSVTDGITIIENLRKAHYEFPIMIITSKGSFEDKKRGFEAGADDYLVKPFDMNEMILRVNALLRRSNIIRKKRLEIGRVVLDYDALSVIAPAGVVELPKKEFYLLFKLLSYPKRVFTRHELMDEIWGMDAGTGERTVDVHIKRIREKLSHIEEFRIVTVRGLGYKAEKTAGS